MPVASAQVKSALLLSGLYADGPTILEEPVLSRDHTERMMLSLGVPLQTAGASVVLDPNADWSDGWEPFEWHVPGDPSERGVPAACRCDGSRQSGERRGGVRESNAHRSVRLAPVDRRRQSRIDRADTAPGDEPMAEISVAHRGIRGSLAARGDHRPG